MRGVCLSMVVHELCQALPSLPFFCPSASVATSASLADVVTSINNSRHGCVGLNETLFTVGAAVRLLCR